MTKDSMAMARALLIAEGGDDATRSSIDLAAGVEKIWMKITHHFSTLIGDSGVQSVLQRSARLAAVSHPWLLPVSQWPAIGEGSFRAAFEQESVVAGVAGLEHLISIFVTMLARFIGDELVGRLFEEIWPGIDVAGRKEMP